jgi:hypothetical protein
VIARACALIAVMVLAGCGVASTQTTPTANNRRAQPAGVVDYRITHPEYLTHDHHYGHIQYPTSPPVGGDSNPHWQNCLGDAYTAPIANELAVHSMEDGAVWVTYRPDLPGEQYQTLKALVEGRPFTFMSPFPGLDRPISLQAWGYQLKVDNADDLAIVAFIRAYRLKAAVAPAATCSGGITVTAAAANLWPP